MARFPRLDPDYPEGSVLSTKLAPSDAERVIELATAAGLTKSGFVRQAVLDALEREDEPPPDG